MTRDKIKKLCGVIERQRVHIMFMDDALRGAREAVKGNEKVLRLIDQAINFEALGAVTCAKCKRLLRGERSRERGLGPVCYKNSIKGLQKGLPL